MNDLNLLLDKAVHNLSPVEPEVIQRLLVTFPNLPQDYVEFLQKAGYGEVGQAAFMLYDGLIKATEVYAETREKIKNIYLFGDDFAGCSVGYQIDDWAVVEIDSTGMAVEKIADDFESFIRKLILNAS